MSNPRTLGDLARSLTSDIHGLDAAEARRRINVAYVNEAMAHGWAHLIREFTLQTEPSYSTGTVNVANGLTAISLTGGTWSVGWTTTPSMRRIVIQGRPEPYNITILTAATGTLGDPWIGDSNAAATYVMFRDTYPFPADCGYAKLMALFDLELRGPLTFVGQSTFLRDMMTNPQLVNLPEEFAIVGQTGETPPRAQFRMYPAAGTVRAYRGYYFMRPSFMTSDAEYPLWPYEFQEMLPLSAKIAHFSSTRFYSPKYIKLFTPPYADLYSRMVKETDGGSALVRIIEDASTRRRGPWNPDVMSFVGTEMTRS